MRNKNACNESTVNGVQMHKGLVWHEVEFILILFSFTFCELFFYSEYWQDARHLENIVHVALEKQQYKKKTSGFEKRTYCQAPRAHYRRKPLKPGHGGVGQE